MLNSNTYLSDFAQGSAFFSKVDNNSASSPLSLLYCLFNSENEVRATGADVRSEHVGSIAFIMDTKSQFDIGIGHLRRVTKAINGQPSDWGKEQFYVTTSNKFRV